MHVDEQHVAVLVDQLDRLVRAPVLVDLDQTAEPPHAVIDMHHVIARFELVQLGDGHLLVAPDLAVDAVTLVTVEELVVGITAEAERMVDEPLVQRDTGVKTTPPRPTWWKIFCRRSTWALFSDNI